MQKRTLCNYQVAIDREATEKWYIESAGWGCECGHCRNFLKLAKARELPLYIKQILDDLHILPEKATYVCELYTDDRGILYQFSYRIAGAIIHTPDKENTAEGHCCHESYPYGAPNFPEPHFDLEFFEWLPWVLDEPQK